MSNVVALRPEDPFDGPLAALHYQIMGIEILARTLTVDQLRASLDAIARTMRGSPWLSYAPASIVSEIIEAELIKRGSAA
jgi:hypothetical protein